MDEGECDEDKDNPAAESHRDVFFNFFDKFQATSAKSQVGTFT